MNTVGEIRHGDDVVLRVEHAGGVDARIELTCFETTNVIALTPAELARLADWLFVLSLQVSVNHAAAALAHDGQHVVAP